MQKLKAKIPRKRISVIGGVALIVACGWYGFNRKNPTPDVITEQPEIITHSTDTPAEDKPSSSYKWLGTDADPKYIRLTNIDTEGFIQKVGVDQNREVAVPTNIHIAGWFVESARPGQAGLSIIDGHVDGRYNTGIFKRLVELKDDDEFTVELGDGKVLRYRVKRIVSTEIKDAANVLFSQDPAVKSQLNLITCGGNFDSQSRQYDKRVIAVSELIK